MSKRGGQGEHSWADTAPLSGTAHSEGTCLGLWWSWNPGTEEAPLKDPSPAIQKQPGLASLRGPLGPLGTWIGLRFSCLLKLFAAAYPGQIRNCHCNLAKTLRSAIPTPKLFIRKASPPGQGRKRPDESNAGPGLRRGCRASGGKGIVQFRIVVEIAKL